MNKEIWLPIKGYEGLYEISNLGRVKSLERTIKYKNGKSKFKKCTILNIKPGKWGYIRAYLTNLQQIEKSFFVHRLVAEYFIPNPDNKPQVNHKNSIRHDNAVENLEWCTCSENIRHAFKEGFKKPLKGLDCPSHKLTEQQVLEIRSKKFEGESYSYLSSLYSISISNVCHIVKRRTWTHI